MKPRQRTTLQGVGAVGQKPAAEACEYTATAIVYVGNEQFHCRATDLSVRGVVLFPQVRRTAGSFIRINLCLPAFQDLLDVDGVVARETVRNGYYAWRVHFHEIPAAVEVLVRTYVTWDKYRQVRLVRGEQDAPKRSPTATHEAIQRRVTGPNLPRVTTDMFPRVRPTDLARAADGGGTMPHDLQRARQRRQAEARWQARQAAAKAKHELRKLYREALKDLGQGGGR